MVDLEKVIHGLEDFIESYKQAFDDDGYAPLDDALSLLKAQDVPDTNVGEWISVKDRMPEYNGEYIVHFSASDAVLSAYYFKNQGGFRVGANIVTDSVLHWMPLPEPPKKKT